MILDMHVFVSPRKAVLAQNSQDGISRVRVALQGNANITCVGTHCLKAISWRSSLSKQAEPITNSRDMNDAQIPHRLPQANAQGTCCQRVRSSHLQPMRPLLNCAETSKRSTQANRCGARRPSQLVKALSATTPATSSSPIRIRLVPRSCRHSGRSLKPKACASSSVPSIF